MAIYHLRVKITSRGKGHSAVAAAAYRSGEKLHDERTGKTHDYSRKRHVEHREIMAPDGVPEWVFDRQKLWNAVEASEKRKDARTAREVEVALPRELDAESCIATLRAFAQEQFVRRGMIADICIHRPNAADGNEHPHAHILLTTRAVTGGGFGAKVAEWNKVELLEEWREQWARHANRALERRGVMERIDHRTLDAQREEALSRGDNVRAAALDREPEPSIGLGRHIRQTMRELSGRIRQRFNHWVEVSHRKRLIPELVALKGRDLTAYARDAAMLMETRARELGISLDPERLKHMEPELGR